MAATRLLFRRDTCSIASCPAPRGQPEKLVSCVDCGASGHQACLLFSDNLFKNVQNYAWQCIECKTCSACNTPGDDEHLMLCDDCDRGYHIYCVYPPFDTVPADSWVCDQCRNGSSPIKPRERSNSSSSTGSLNLPRLKKLERKPQRVLPPRPHTGRPSSGPVSLGPRSLDKWSLLPSSSPSPRKRLRKDDVDSSECESSNEVVESPKSNGSAGKAVRTTPSRTPKIESIAIVPPSETFESFAVKHFQQHPPVTTLPPLEVDIDRCEPNSEDLKRFHQAATLANHEEHVDKIESICFGQHTIPTWYSAPYPNVYFQSTIYICEFCLKPLTSDFASERHKLKCQWRHPPGDEIYRKGRLSVFEVDGKKSTLYCQDLCLLAKLFLDHKTLLYDVEPFMFYVMTEYNNEGYHFIGYFSKEKRSLVQNVCCIVILPIYQKQGYGQWLIDFSYLLTRKENKLGSPERPLSAHGLRSYKFYWKVTVCYKLLKLHDLQRHVSFEDLCQATGMTETDMEEVLTELGFLTKKRGVHLIEVDLEKARETAMPITNRTLPQVDASCLRWTPAPTSMY